jgi:hypothetical protein
VNIKIVSTGLSEKKKKKKDDRCTRIAKRKYDVWPSAYASGAVVKCRQGKIWKGVKEGEENLESKIRQALRDEGGAAGMDALEKHTDASAEEVKKAIQTMNDVGQHEDGDYILDDGEDVDIVDEDLRKWFGRKGAKGSESGWVDCNTCRKDKKTGKKTCKSCGRQKGEKRSKYPACRPTPSACGERGDWGKKSKKSEGLEMKISEDKIKDLIQEEMEEVYLEFLAEGETIDEAEYQGRKVTLNKPTRGDVKKFKVYVKNEKGNVVKVNFGDPNMKIRKSNPKARKSFRARHNCDNPGPKWKARYWSCKKW